MAKASLTLPNGTHINIEGTPEEIHKLIEFYGNSSVKTKKVTEKPKNKKGNSTDTSPGDYITQIINLIKDCEESDAIEENIIDSTGQVDKVLLPLYVSYAYLDNAVSLQSGEISKITKELGIPISQPNASRALSGTAARYIMGDRVRKARQAVKYKLNRRGFKYLKGVIQGKQDG